jgi:cytochrome c oxidase subunit 4
MHTSAQAHSGTAHGAKLYVSVWVWLVVLTGIEVFLAYEQVPLKLMLVLLVGLSLVKAALIMAYFMHLRFERLSLFLTLVPIMVACLCLMMIFFPDSFRLYEFGLR